MITCTHCGENITPEDAGEHVMTHDPKGSYIERKRKTAERKRRRIARDWKYTSLDW